MPINGVKHKNPNFSHRIYATLQNTEEAEYMREIALVTKAERYGFF